jgi:hypothetical protein
VPRANVAPAHSGEPPSNVHVGRAIGAPISGRAGTSKRSTRVSFSGISYTGTSSLGAVPVKVRASLS